MFEDASEKGSITNSDSGHSSGPTGSLSASDDEVNKTGGGETGGGETVVSPTLEESIQDITKLLAMALNNRFHEAYEGTSKWSHCSLYHALGKGTLSFLKGCLTIERVSFLAFRGCIWHVS